MKYYSKHSFMFPFQWDFKKSNRKKDTYNNRTKLSDFDRLFMYCESGFKKEKFTISDARKYNEYNYFHAFVRKVLYHTEEEDFLRYYEIDEPDGEYNIEITKNGQSEILTLVLDSVCLHVYDTGVGVITFNLTNDKYSDEKSILKINEFGRRLYPQFMSKESPLASKNAFLANRIWGQIGNLHFDEDFSVYTQPLSVDFTFIPPDHLLKIFGYQGATEIGDRGQSFVFNKVNHKENTIRIRQITDDRMFFLCWYGNNVLCEKLKEYSSPKKEGLTDEEKLTCPICYEFDPFWFSFVYGDTESPSVQDIRLQREDIAKSTYTRWLGYGTLFGVTRDSFVCTSSDKETLDRFYAPPVYEHMQTMYYQMAILCLVQRATILRFSWEISQITNQLFHSKRNPKNAITDLYENYLRFINQIYFREVTSQIQGIELYTMFQRAMNLEKEAKDLDGEMQELFNYLSVKEQTKLSRVADLFLPITLLAGILGINIFNGTWISEILTVILILWSVYALISYFYHKTKK